MTGILGGGEGDSVPIQIIGAPMPPPYAIGLAIQINEKLERQVNEARETGQ